MRLQFIQRDWLKLSNKIFPLALSITLAVGIGLRLWHFFGGRSLHADEAKIALNIMERTWPQLFDSLDYDQLAPIGWLLLVKTSNYLFGHLEYSLRLIPLVFGLLSFTVFVQLARQQLGNLATILTIIMFAMVPSLIYFSADVKQYSADVFFSALIMLVFFYLLRTEKLDFSRIAILWSTGAAALLFSHPSIFVLAACGSALVVQKYLRRAQWETFLLVITGVLWLTEFIFLYLLMIETAGQNFDAMGGFWKGAFAPAPPSSLQDVYWYYNKSKGFFAAFGISAFALTAGISLLGLVSLMRKEPYKVAILIGPLAFVLAASALKLYPFTDRFLLLLAPQFFLALGFGFQELRTLYGFSFRSVCFVFALLAAEPLAETAINFTKSRPFEHQDMKAALQVLDSEYQEQDVLYVYYGGRSAFRLYRRDFSFEDLLVIEGRSPRQNWDNFLADIDSLRRHKRVWLLFSHITAFAGLDEPRFFKYFAQKFGEEIEHFSFQGAELILYEFSTTTGPFPQDSIFEPPAD